MRDDAVLLTADGTELPAWKALYWLTLACDRLGEEYQAAGRPLDWTAPVESAGPGEGEMTESGPDGTEGSRVHTLSDYAKEQALSDTLLYAAVDSLAARCGAALEDVDQAALEDQWRTRCEEHGGEAAYLALLSRFGLDREKSLELYRTGRLYGKLCRLCRGEDGASLPEGLMPDAEQYAVLERASREIRYDRILAAGGDRSAARSRAAALFARLNGAADQAALFAELAAQGDDAAGPRSLSESPLDGKLTAAVQALEIGQLSGIVENREGFSILRRLPPERGPILETWLDRTLEAAAARLRVEVSAAWEDLDAGAFAERLAELRAGT